MAAEMLGQFDGKSGDAACAPLDQNGFAGLELQSFLDGDDRRQPGQGQTRGLDVAHAIGLFRDDRGLHGDLFRIGAFLTTVTGAERRHRPRQNP